MDIVEGFLVFVFALALALVLAIFQALFIFWIFSVINIEFLDNLTYWQVFGLTAAVSIATTHASSSD